MIILTRNVTASTGELLAGTDITDKLPKNVIDDLLVKGWAKKVNPGAAKPIQVDDNSYLLVEESKKKAKTDDSAADEAETENAEEAQGEVETKAKSDKKAGAKK